jgi:tryptophanyl-tRNA synthetase
MNIANKINDYFTPVHNKRSELENNLDYIKDVLQDGEKKASEAAEKTMCEVREAMKLG